MNQNEIITVKYNAIRGSRLREPQLSSSTITTYLRHGFENASRLQRLNGVKNEIS